MALRPILSALLRNRAGAILVAVQIAITLAIVVNAVYVTQQRVQKIGRPSGIDDQNIFWFATTGFGKDFDFKAMVREDLALLRQMPDVVDAAPMQQIPLSGSGNSTWFHSLPDKKGAKSEANYFPTDEHGIDALGAELSAGTTFDPNTVEFRSVLRTGLSTRGHHQPGTRERAVPRTAGARQDVLRHAQQAIRGRRRHRAHSRVVGWLG